MSNIWPYFSFLSNRRSSRSGWEVFLRISYYTLKNFLMMLSAILLSMLMILLSVILSVIKNLIRDNN